MSYQLAYLVGVGLLCIAWFLLFLNKPYRHEMLITGLFFAPFTFLDLWFVHDYWQPVTFLGSALGIESFIGTFLIGGIAAVVYEELKRYKLVKAVRQPSWILAGSFLILLLNFIILKYLGLNSMYALYAVFVAEVVFVYVRRKDLLSDVLWSGVFFGFLWLFLFSVYLLIFPTIVGEWWKLENLSGLLIFGIPLEELMFAFGFGMVAGPLYEVWQGYRLESL